MTTLQTLQAAVQAVQAEQRSIRGRLSEVERRQWIFMKQWITWHLTSSTSGKIEQTGPTLTGHTAPVRMAHWRHGLKYLPRILGWLAEKLFAWLAPWVLPALAAAWAMGRERLEAAWAWVANCWHWFFG